MAGVLYAAAGGACGAAARYIISCIPLKTAFPLLTLITNFLGAVLIGVVVGAASARSDMSPYFLLFWKTGVCGGFTTFSAFSLEAVGLFESGRFFGGITYVSASFALCFLGVIAGRYAARFIF